MIRSVIRRQFPQLLFCLLAVLFLLGPVQKARGQSCSLLCNTDFELPQFGGWTMTTNGHVPCWYTTASDSNIEVWWTGFNGVPAYSGNQFIELNAYLVATMYQNFNASPGTNLSIGFAHRGRAGVDTMSVSIGPVGGPYTTIGTYGDSNATWGYHVVNYTIPAGSGSFYSLRFNSIYSTGGNQSIGNFLDDISVSLPGADHVTATSTPPHCHGGSDGSVAATATGGTPPYSYNWSPSGGISSSASGLSPGTYTISIRDAQGCAASATVVVVQPAAIAQSFHITPASCSGSSMGSATVTASGGGAPYTYSWDPGGQTTSSVSNLSPGLYTCYVTDTHGCSSSDTMSISGSAGLSIGFVTTYVNCVGSPNGTITTTTSGGSGAYTYSWFPGNSTTAFLSHLDTGTYTVSVTDSLGCTGSGSVALTHPPSIAGVTGSVQANCFGSATGSASINASGGTGAYTYSWHPGGQATSSVSNVGAGTYTVFVTDAAGCTVSFLDNVGQPSQLIVGITSSQNTSCGLNNGSAVVSAGGSVPPYSYTWNPGGLSGSSVSGLAPGTYTVIVNDANNCPGSVSVTILASNPPAPASFTGLDTNGCPTLCVHFTNTTPSATNTVWNFGDGTTGTGNTPLHCYPNSGNYTVSLSTMDANNCSTTASHNGMVHVYPKPVAAFTVVPNPANANEAAQFSSTGTGATTWYWKFGGGQGSSVLQNPVYTYTDSGTYLVTLLVTNSFGCRDSVNSEVVVHSKGGYLIPNTFSPDGDGKNDLFIVTADDYPGFHIEIYDRWGVEVFESDNQNNSWNGKVHNTGPNVSDGTYYYILNLTDWHHSSKTLAGFIGLFRR
jgi:gliding motility-associated-like protein